jgi:hypothetical protein
MLRVLKDSITSRGYKYHEKQFEERVSDNGKELFIEIRPMKIRTAWTSMTMYIIIELTKIKEVHLDVDGVTTAFQQGDIRMKFDGWVTIGIRERWGNKPIFYFVKSLFNKYVYQFPIERGLPGEVASDTRYIHAQVKSHLNLYQYLAKGAVQQA